MEKSIFTIVNSLSKRNFGKKEHNLESYYENVEKMLHELMGYLQDKESKQLEEDVKKLKMALKVNSAYKTTNPMPFVITGILAMINIQSSIGLFRNFEKIENWNIYAVFFAVVMIILVGVASVFSVTYLFNLPIIEVNNYLYEEAISILEEEIKRREIKN